MDRSELRACKQRRRGPFPRPLTEKGKACGTAGPDTTRVGSVDLNPVPAYQLRGIRGRYTDDRAPPHVCEKGTFLGADAR